LRFDKNSSALWTKSFINQDLIQNHHQKIDIPDGVVCGFGVAM
jgi:hypothetical protein